MATIFRTDGTRQQITVNKFSDITMRLGSHLESRGCLFCKMGIHGSNPFFGNLDCGDVIMLSSRELANL